MTISNDQLTRTTGSPAKTVVFLGNGGIQNGWLPIRTVLDKWIKNDPKVADAVKALRAQNSEAFHQLALLSYKFKVARAHEFTAWKNAVRKPAETEKQGFSGLVPGFLELRDEIASEYKKAASQLTLRSSKEIQALIGPDAAYITTNWDESAWSDPAIKNIIQLHGRCSYGHSLVFPTELLVEDTAYDLKPMMQDISKCSPAFQEQVYSAFRYRSMTALFNAHITATEWLRKAERLVIWGFSLGDYDADVNALLGTYTAAGIKELVVINPDTAAFFRAVALTGDTNAVHFNPVTGIKLRFA